MKITKKIFGVVSLVALGAISLVSCTGNGEDLSVTRRATPSDETKKLYNLDFTSENSTEIYTSDTYSIYAAKDIKASLFYNEIDVVSLKDKNDNNLFDTDGEKLRNINSQSLVFSDGTSALYSTEISQYVNLLYGSDGISEKLKRTDLDFTPDYSASWTKTSDLKTPYEYYVNNGLTELRCDIVYLPTYFVRKNNGNVVLEQYIITPIYTAYTYSNGEMEIVNGEGKKSSIKNLKKVSLKFKEGSNTILAV